MSTALLVIDAQKIYTDPESDLYCSDSKATIKRINELITKFQKRNRPVLYVRHVHKNDASDLGRMFDFTGEAEDDFNFKANSEEVEYDANLTVLKNAKEIIKNRYSAFEGTNLEKTLRSLKVSTVAICGFMTNFCCESTARSAHDKDFFVDFVVDATGTPGTDNMSERRIRKVVSELLGAGFSRVVTSSSYLEKI